VQRPLTAAPHAMNAAAAYQEQNRTMSDGSGTMRIISAKGDLSGEQEMLWVTGDGEPAGGGASCTQKFRFAQNTEPAVRPTMLLCWRISESRSVIVLAVSKEKPSRKETVSTLTSQWEKLG
jgi:hypothetical protein